MTRAQARRAPAELEEEKNGPLESMSSITTVRLSYDVKVTSLYCIKIPAGFHKKDLPLMKVRVRLPGEAQERIYRRYSDVKERFPKQVLDFFEQQVVVLRHNEDSNLDSEEEAARRREWMRSISRQQQSHQMYSRPPHQQQQRQSTLQVQSRVVEESVVGGMRLHHQREQ